MGVRIPSKREVRLSADPTDTKLLRVASVAACEAESPIRVAEEQLLESQLLAVEILDTLREAALILGPGLCVERANSAFLHLFDNQRSAVEGRALFDLGGAWGSPFLRLLLEGPLPSSAEGTPATVELVHDPGDEAVARILCVNASSVSSGSGAQGARHIFLEIEDITDKRRGEWENERLRADARNAENRRAILLRDVLSCATEGRLLLCLSEADLPSRPAPCAVPVALTLPTLRDLRHQVRHVAHDFGISPERVDDFENAVGEAAMNAVVHAGGGKGCICVIDSPEAPRIQVWISDAGKGIELQDIPRAVLEKGFTTSGTMGQGFKIVLRMADRVHLLTNGSGTTVVIEQEKVPPVPAWLRNLSNDVH